jgi:hypothetical protein
MFHNFHGYFKKRTIDAIKFIKEYNRRKKKEEELKQKAAKICQINRDYLAYFDTAIFELKGKHEEESVEVFDAKTVLIKHIVDNISLAADIDKNIKTLTDMLSMIRFNTTYNELTNKTIVSICLK